MLYIEHNLSVYCNTVYVHHSKTIWIFVRNDCTMGRQLLIINTNSVGEFPCFKKQYRNYILYSTISKFWEKIKEFLNKK